MILHHIGIACKSIPNEIEKIKKYHDVINVSEIIYDGHQDAEVCLVSLDDNTRLELIAGNKVANIVKKGMGYYHLCYQVDDINDVVQRLVSQGAKLISGPVQASLFESQVAFLYLSYGLIELLEIKKNE